MRLSSQRVLASDGTHGINSFYYQHGPTVWLDTPPIEVQQSSGVLVNSHLRIRPGGNRVLSYLDVVAPDSTPNHRLSRAIVDSIDLFRNPDFPLRVQIMDILFTFDIDANIAPAWREEIVALLGAVMKVRGPDGSYPSPTDEPS